MPLSLIAPLVTMDWTAPKKSEKRSSSLPCRAYAPSFNCGDLRSELLNSVNVQWTPVWGPVTAGIDRLTLLMRRM